MTRTNKDTMGQQHAPGPGAIQAESWFPHGDAKCLLIYYMPWRRHYHDPQVGNYLQWSPHHSVKNASLISAPSVAQHPAVSCPAAALIAPPRSRWCLLPR